MIEISTVYLMQPYTHNSIPTSLTEIYDFIVQFNGNQQPIIHDYPWTLPLITIPLYWLLVFVGPKIMKNRKPWSLKSALMLWNFFLFVLSVIMALGICIPMFQFLFERSWYQLMCMPEGELYYGSPFFCVWLFALSKYIELIDTVFIILRKRPLHFIHWYHHTTVLAYTWFGLVCMTSPGAVFAGVNACVHSIMYYYYFLASTGRKPSWGKLVTIIQLTQMVIGISISVSWTYYYLTRDHCPMSNPNAYILSTSALYGSYFILFLNFYIQRYILVKPRQQQQQQNNNNTKVTKSTNSPTKKTRKPKKD